MPNRSADSLFQLIHSLQKSEKRNFKLYVNRNSSNNDLKVIQLFDALEGMTVYDEESLLKKSASITKQQLSNIKAHLYKQVLASLRLLENKSIDILIHEQLDNARILYNKGLYMQSLKVLEKSRELAKSNNQFSLLVQVLFMEKKIETLHITRSLKERANQLITESEEVNERVIRITKLSNLSLYLYSWYINNGHARNEKDESEIRDHFQEYLTEDLKKGNSFYEKLYLYQSYCWFAFIRQDFLMYYRYTQLWVDLFRDDPKMIDIETANYIKGVHNLLNAHFTVRNYPKFEQELKSFEAFAESETVHENDNNRIQVFVYLYIAKINEHFLYGTFKEGILMVPFIIDKLKEYQLHLDMHRVLVFYYKIASLYFGAGDYSNTIEYLNKIINWRVDLRTDLQCYSRLLNLIAHYEIGNFDLLEYLIKSVYRFMAKMENLSLVEEEMFRFLRKSFQLSPRKMKPEFEKLLERMKQLEASRFETRAFVYLDIISWLESKVYEKPVYQIIHDKYLLEREKNNKRIRN